MTGAPSATELLKTLQDGFDRKYYLEANQDVAEAGMDPFQHFVLSGLSEGRAPGPNLSASTVMEQVATRLGRLPARSDLEEILRTYVPEGRLPTRAKALVRRSLQRAGTVARGIAKRSRDGARAATGLSSKYPSYAHASLDLHAFNALNSAGKVFLNHKGAADYLLEEGYKSLDPIDFHCIPDPDFARSLYPEYTYLTDEDIYLRWLKTGAFEGRFIGESQMLRAVGSRSTHLLDAFPAEDYRAAYPDIPLNWNPAQLLHHFLNSGLPEGRFSFPITPPVLSVIEDVIEDMARKNPARAQQVIERLLVSGVNSPRLAIAGARGALAAGQLVSAQAMLGEQTSDVPVEEFWLNHLRAEVQKRAERFDAALSSEATARDMEFQSVWARKEFESLLRQSFEASRHKAKRLADMGRMDEAQALLQRAIDTAYESLLPYGTREHSAVAAPPLDKRPLRVGMFSDKWLPQCTLYRVDQKAEQLRKAGAHVKVYDFRKDAEAAIQDAGLYDLWIVYRVPALFDPIRFVRTANLLGRPTIYEIDDLLFDTAHFPEPLEAYGGNIAEEEYRGLQMSTVTTAGMARLCTHAMGSTATLTRELAGLVPGSVALEHHNALSGAHMKAMATAQTEPSRQDDGRVRIFYGSGTKAHKDYLEETFFAALDEIMTRHPNVEFHAIGYVNAKQLKANHGDRIFEAEPIWDIQEYWAALRRNDINVAVLKKSLLTDAKSEIKWLEAAMFGLPSVVSGTATHRDVIEDGKTGLFADTREEWVSQLSRLIEDPALRASIGTAAREDVLSRYNLDTMSASLAEGLESVLADKASNSGDTV